MTTGYEYVVIFNEGVTPPKEPTAPTCPFCGTELVKIWWEACDRSGWTLAWTCNCTHGQKPPAPPDHMTWSR
jgi:hypothetical protein